MGYLVKWEEGGAKIVLEADTIDCRHCQKVLLKHAWREQGGWCFKCGWPVCAPCFAKLQTDGCRPFRQQVEHAWEQLHKKGV
jgi:hypothetical protein